MADADPLKILWLSHSNDNRRDVAPGSRRPEVMARKLGAALDRPVEVTIKPVVPADRLPDIVQGWLERDRPDVVWLTTASYWFTYESAPLRMKRHLGWLGRKAGETSEQLGRQDRFATKAWFRAVRRATQLAIGGDTVMTPGQALERMSRTARVIAQREHITLILEGPRGRADHFQSRRAARRGEARRLEVHRGLAALARELRCSYLGNELPLHEDGSGLTFQGDRVHMDEAGHARSAEMDFAVLLQAVTEA
jgi:hypothetical protein